MHTEEVQRGQARGVRSIKTLNLVEHRLQSLVVYFDHIEYLQVTEKKKEYLSRISKGR
jgi:hypothetical protein